MDKTPISTKYSWKKLTPDDDKHYLFGYYDRNPWDHTLTRHLALQVDQCERLPERGETATLGYVTADQQKFHPLTTTRAWCHQQGRMSLFLPHRRGCFIYNDYEEETEKIIAKIFDLEKGVVGKYDLPVYAISVDTVHDGKRGICLLDFDDSVRF